MKNKRYLTAILLTFPAVAGMSLPAGVADARLRTAADSTVTSGVAARGVRIQHAGDPLVVTLDLVLASVDVHAHQRYVATPAPPEARPATLPEPAVVNGPHPKSC